MRCIDYITPKTIEYPGRVTHIVLNWEKVMLSMAALSSEAPPSEQKSQSLIGKVSMSLQLPLEVPVAIDTSSILICPAKLIIGRTLKIWQLDVLAMQIINIKNCELKLDFYPYFEVALLCLFIVCNMWEVTPRQKTVTSTLSIFGCWSPFTKSSQQHLYKI